MRRVSAAVVFATLMMTAGARASSFVTLDAMDEPTGPSFVTLGEPEKPAVATLDTAPDDTPHSASTQTASLPAPPDDGQRSGEDNEFIDVSPSIIAMAEPAMPVSNENVASITPDDEPESDANDPIRQFGSLPTVIRGGIVGDAFARSATAPSPAKSAAPTATASASPRDKIASQRVPEKEPEPQKQRPKPQPVAVPSGLPRLSGPE